MVEKKINFNRPILSVRRRSAKMAASHDGVDTKTKNAHPQTPDLSSGPARNPVAVPFQWEQIPGKPKEETKRQGPPLNGCQDIGDNEIRDEDCDESLVDETDSLSITESFISSCSMSSLNGDDDDHDSSRTLSMEPEEEVKKEVVKQEKPGFWYRPTFAKSCSYYNEKQVGDDHDHDEHEKMVAICCLLPRSCLKSSVCFVNPVPATSVMGRLSVFPSTGVLSGCSSADSLSETENEDAATKSVAETDENKKKANVVKGSARLESCYGGLPFVEGFGSRENSFRTLQELLADEDSRKELESACGDHFNIMSLVDETSERTRGKTSPKHFDLYVETRKKGEEKQQLSRSTTLGNSHIARFPTPPPLPRSPSDSWLFRAMATKKASSPSFISRRTNKS